MSGLLPPSTKQSLSRSKLLVRTALPAGGIGERRSASRGAGLEFADYRSYQPGDDFRFLDPHVYARLGQRVTRTYALDQQLEVAILLDASASMLVGSPSKHRRGLELAAALAFAGLAGGDRVLLGVCRENDIAWHAPVSSGRSLPDLLQWLEGLGAHGAMSVTAIAKRSLQRLRPDGLTVVISDWLFESVPDALTTWATAKQDLVAIQLLAPEELTPGDHLAGGDLTLVDSESGEELAGVDVDAVSGNYVEALNGWRAELQQACERRAARWFSFSTEEAVAPAMLAAFRRGGLLL